MLTPQPFAARQKILGCLQRIRLEPKQPAYIIVLTENTVFRQHYGHNLYFADFRCYAVNAVVDKIAHVDIIAKAGEHRPAIRHNLRYHLRTLPPTEFIHEALYIIPNHLFTPFALARLISAGSNKSS